jgi:hypothetical protein
MRARLHAKSAIAVSASEVIIVPRGLSYTSPAPGGKPGLTWTVKYGFVGANAFGADHVVDGLNEAGLSVGRLYLPGYAGYQELGPQETHRALAHWQVGALAGGDLAFEQLCDRRGGQHGDHGGCGLCRRPAGRAVFTAIALCRL